MDTMHDKLIQLMGLLAAADYLRQDIVAKLDTIPQNPDITVLNLQSRCFVIAKSALHDSNWSPEYYDWHGLTARLKAWLLECDIAAFMKRLPIFAHVVVSPFQSSTIVLRTNDQLTLSREYRAEVAKVLGTAFLDTALKLDKR